VAVEVTEADSDDFARETKAILRALIFPVPKDWAEIGGMQRRFKFQVVFAIAGLAPPPQAPGVPTVVITRRGSK
jgi:hypothetical protein